MMSQSSIRSISLGGLVLLGLFLSVIVGSLFPVLLLKPEWQLKVGTVLINTSPLALIGLITLHLTADLEPEDSVLISRRSIACKFAVLAAIGFLLLAPLLSVASVRLQRQQISQQATFERRADSNLQALRQVVSKAADTTELYDKLVALNGPVLNDADRNLALPVIKSRVNELLDEAEKQIALKKQQLPPINPLFILPDVLRNAFASFILAIGFAGLARRPGVDISLLMELQECWYSSRIRKSKSRRKNSQVQEDLDYLGQISGEDEVK